jgi:hypothetical protein
MIAWWLLVSAPVIASLLTSTGMGRALSGESEKKATVGGAVFLGCNLVCVLASLPWLEAQNPVLNQVRGMRRTESDLEAVAQRLPSGGAPARIFSRFEWGEYLSWSLAERGCTVFMDGRIEIYPDAVWDDYSAVTRGRADWQQILDRYGVDYLVLDTDHHGDLLPQVRHSAAWREANHVGTAVLFQRAGGGSQLARTAGSR